MQGSNKWGPNNIEHCFGPYICFFCVSYYLYLTDQLCFRSFNLYQHFPAWASTPHCTMVPSPRPSACTYPRLCALVLLSSSIHQSIGVLGHLIRGGSQPQVSPERHKRNMKVFRSLASAPLIIIQEITVKYIGELYYWILFPKCVNSWGGRSLPPCAKHRWAEGLYDLKIDGPPDTILTMKGEEITLSKCEFTVKCLRENKNNQSSPIPEC